MTLAQTLEFRKQIRLMGSAFEFVVVSNADAGPGLLEEAIAEVKRLEDLLTEFKETSFTSQLNKNAGIAAVRADTEVYALLKRCATISALTQGAFDITAGALKKLYNFKGKSFTLPKTSHLHDALAHVGHQKVQLQKNNEVYLEKPGMHISFAAIGKGYAADCVKRLLQNKGVTGGVINASGDLTAWGTRADGSDWKVGIANPKNPDTILAWIPVKENAVATSGDYEQYFEHNGIRYGHTIDPRTGAPSTGIKSVTIVSPSGELSDALATAVTIMGKDVGLHFINQLPGIHCLIIDDQDHLSTSNHFQMTSSIPHHEKKLA